MADHAFGTSEPVNPGEVVTVGFEWFSLLAIFWKPAVEYAVSAYVRPSRATGFAYQCSRAGQSGNVEPKWSRVLGETVNDGDVTWTVVDAGSNAVQAATSPIVTCDQAVTIGSPVVVDGLGASSKVQVLVSNWVDGLTHSLRCQITAGSQTLKGTLAVPVSIDV